MKTQYANTDPLIRAVQMEKTFEFNAVRFAEMRIRTSNCKSVNDRKPASFWSAVHTHLKYKTYLN